MHPSIIYHLILILVGEATAGVVAAVRSGASMTEESSMIFFLEISSSFFMQIFKRLFTQVQTYLPSLRIITTVFWNNHVCILE